MFQEMLLFGALVPGVAAGLLALLAARGAGGEEPRFAPGAVAMGGGFAVAFLAAFGTDGLMQPLSWHAVLWVSLAAGASGLLPLRGADWLRPGAGVIATAVLLHWMLARLVPHDLEAAAAWWMSLALALGAGVLASLTEGAAKRLPARAFAPALLVFAAGNAALLFELGSARLGQMAGFLAAGGGALAALCWFAPDRPWLRGTGLPVTAILIATGANAYFFGYDVAGTPLLVAAAPPLLWRLAGAWPRLQRGVFLPTAILTLATALPLALAWWLAANGGEADPYGVPELPY